MKPSMSTRPAFLETMLATPQEAAATTVIRKGTAPPPVMRGQAIRTRPKLATRPPITWCGPGRSPMSNGGEENREEDLRLHHHGGEARRHAQAKRREEQAELRHAEKEAVGDDMAPIGLGPRDEDDGRQGREEEAQRREQQRRRGADPELDDDEAQAPDGRDEKGDEAVAERHLLKTGPALSKH